MTDQRKRGVAGIVLRLVVSRVSVAGDARAARGPGAPLGEDRGASRKKGLHVVVGGGRYPSHHCRIGWRRESNEQSLCGHSVWSYNLAGWLRDVRRRSRRGGGTFGANLQRPASAGLHHGL